MNQCDQGGRVIREAWRTSPLEPEPLAERSGLDFGSAFIDRIGEDIVANRFVFIDAPTMATVADRGAATRRARRFTLQLRIETAMRLMTDTDFQLSEVALSSGFGDQSTFSRSFVRFTGVTPFKL